MNLIVEMMLCDHQERKGIQSTETLISPKAMRFGQKSHLDAIETKISERDRSDNVVSPADGQERSVLKSSSEILTERLHFRLKMMTSRLMDS